ncbi:MAG TPA: LysR family transcriptional regulator [Steroidobacteraceae bacterium]|nr:LysR family transcriptional regulator [Steroidobacteraceae bacterium]
MAALARTSLEQWAVLAAVVDEGGYAQAATALHRSQSAVSYAVGRLQEELDVPLLVIEGRKAVLTPHGQTLLQRARGLLRDMNTLELLARSLKQGWEAELQLVVDAAFPREHLLKIVAELQQLCPNTQMQLSDAVLSGAEDAIADGMADVVVTAHVPSGYVGEFLVDVSFVAVARPEHALFGVGHDLSFEDLTRHVQVVVRDSGVKHPRDEGWLGAERRCTVSSMEASLATVKAGLAYAWLPEHVVAASLRDGTLKPLPLASGRERRVPLYLVLVHSEVAGPAARAAVECFQRHIPVMAARGG